MTALASAWVPSRVAHAQSSPAAPAAAPAPTAAAPGPAPRAAAPDAAEASVPEDLSRLILDAARPTLPKPSFDVIYRFTIHGEEQVRYQGMRTLPLTATASAIAAQPGIAEQSLGQNHFGNHWLRVTPRLAIRDIAELVVQADLLTGVYAGQLARDTSQDLTPRDDYNGYSNIQLRWAYAQYRLPFGLVRVGQQPNHWGLGILTNDGDHPALFGDYRYGSISERLLFATRPGGEKSPLHVAVAADVVYRDMFARLTRGQQAMQGVLAIYYERGPNRLGVFSTLRRQTAEQSAAPATSYTDDLEAAAVDLHGKFAAPVAGEDAYLFGEAEAAVIAGSTNALRTVDPTRANARTSVRSYGGAALIGIVHRRFGTRFWGSGDANSARQASAAYLGKADARGVPYGDLVVQVEAGYASGDADPYDGTQRRFTFDPNHKVGLVLFDEVLRWQTARAATAAVDPRLANGARTTPGADFLPSNGGVFGAQYINPTVVIRPRYWLDLKAGMVVAQSTSDVVDPYRVATGGSYVNYRGGNPTKKDLGIELDAGFEGRFPLDAGVKAVVGAQGGILFPGGALEDANGDRLKNQWLAVGRLGLLF